MDHTLPVYENQFEKHNACVLIPTYNNAGSLATVLKDVQQYTSHILVVNDGSTDDTQRILEQFPQIHKVNYTPNKGKGIALRTGIKAVAELGYTYAITMDSDGQHYAKDLANFLKQLDETPGALMIGARNMDQAHIPGKSSFGNRFSNFWFWVNTGITLPDTQSGYRLYPVVPLAKKSYFTRKYEFEIEVIVRAAWSGIPVISVPVSVYYPPAEERVSHFRPFKDFTRISILNTVLVLISLLWIKPRNLGRMLLKKEGWRTLWNILFRHPEESNQRKAASVGFGIFMGIVPVWGFQLAIGIPLSILFKMNKTLFLIAANISFFPPIIWLASLMTGKWLLGHETGLFDWHGFTWERAMQEATAFFLGGTVLSIISGIVAYLVTFGLLAAFRKTPTAN